MPCPTAAMETPAKILCPSINVQCKDDKKAAYPIDYLRYSSVLKGMFEDLGDSPESITLHMADETTLTYLMSNFVKASYEADNHFADARAKFKELKSQCQNSTSLDLLIQANHLGMTTSIFDKILRRNIPFESLMASLYASYLQEHPFQIVTKDNARYCDGLLYDLEPLVAGWLLYDLCKDMKPEIIRRAFSFSGYFFDVPSISNIGSKNGFVCAWDQMGGSLAMPSKLSYRYTYFDFSKNDPFKEKILSRSPFVQPNQSLPIRQCTLSEDGGYMLLVSGLEQSNVSLYNLSNPEYAGKGQSEGVVPVCSFPVEHSINDIVTALFDNTTGNFNIIARSPSVPGNVKAKTTFYYYSLLPHSKSLQEHGTADCPAILNCDAMQWSCINGEFVGVYQDQKSKDRHVVVRNNNELIMCLFDQENQQWYPAEGNKKKLNFQVINAAASKAGTIEKQHAERAIQDSFIPNFQYCLSHNLSKNLHAHYLKFDALPTVHTIHNPGFTMHTFHFAFEYDCLQQREYWMGPRICLIYNHILQGTHIFDTNMLIGQCGLELAWDF